jgi:hypothetical protein
MNRVVSLLPVEVVATERGKSDPPENGLLVKVGDSFDLRLSDTPQSEFPIEKDKIIWQLRRLEGDGSYTEWDDTALRGVKATGVVMNPGIFQVRAKLQLSSGDTFVEFVRTNDAPYGTGSSGVANPKLKAGEPDFIGFYEYDWQKQLRDEALSHLGETDWSKAGSISGATVGYGVDATLTFTGSWKCNIFMFMQANDVSATVPTRVWRDYHVGIPPWTDRDVPPTADEWEDGATTITDWTWLPNSSRPQPGFSVSRTRFGYTHIGILDYDGTWINAGENDVNKSIHLSDPAYQEAKFRKYDP